MSKDYFPWFSFFLRFFDMGRIVGIFISAGFDKKKRKRHTPFGVCLFNVIISYNGIILPGRQLPPP